MYGRQKKILRNLFEQVQQLRNDPTDFQLCREIQEKLIKQITRAENRARKIKKYVAHEKKELRRRHTDPTRSQTIRKRIEDGKDRLQRAKNITSILRDIGDGLAFIYIDRWDIKPLIFKEHAGSLSGKEGSRLERRVLWDVFNKGGIAILNDLTQSLRHGDITVITGKTFFIVECKSGGGAPERMERQAKAAKKILDYLKSDRATNLFGNNEQILRVEAHSSLRDNSKALNAIIKQAGRGNFIQQVETGLYYAAAHTAKDASALLQPLKVENPLVCHVNNFKHKQTGYYPFVLNFEDANALFEFYEGDLVILQILDRLELSKRFKAHGLDVLTDEIPWKIKDLATGELKIAVSEYYIGRIFAEFLSIDWFVAEIAYRVRIAGEIMGTDTAASSTSHTVKSILEPP